MTHAFNHAACLSIDPFDGDFGEVGDKTLRDRIVIAAANGPCSACHGDIKPGSEIRSLTHRFDGRIATYRYCTKCCVGFAHDAKRGG